MAFRFDRGRRTVVSEIVEIKIVDHCNLMCRSCSALSPVAVKRKVEPSRVHEWLSALASGYHAGRLRMMGGEPLLHRGVVECLEAARASGIADAICLVTNGVLLERADDAVFRAADEIEISEYPSHPVTEARRSALQARAEAHGARLIVKQVAEFRESVASRGTADGSLVERVYRTCEIAHDWGCHNVRDGRFYKCPQAYTIPEQFDAGAAPHEGDGVLLGGADLFERLVAYLSADVPLDACRRCLGGVGKLIPHQQVRRGEWLELQRRTVEDLVDLDYLTQLEQERAGAAGVRGA